MEDPEPRRYAASFQLNLDDAAETVCPHCRRRNDGLGLDLNLTIGPILENVRVLLLRRTAKLSQVIEEIKRTMVEDALRAAQGNKTRAAEILGMKYTTFHALVRRLEKAHPLSDEAESRRSVIDR